MGPESENLALTGQSVATTPWVVIRQWTMHSMHV